MLNDNNDNAEILTNGISKLQFDVWLVDQWGVLHDGTNPYIAAREAMQKLAAQKLVIILSNSGKPSADSESLLANLGYYKGQHYHEIITSGSDVHQQLSLAKQGQGAYAALGKKIYIIARDSNRMVIEGLGLIEVTAIAQADFLLVAGVESGKELADYQTLLDQALAKGLVLICANPDIVSREPDGRLQDCPGRLAAYYQQKGGTIGWHGKPYAPIYESCRTFAKQQLADISKSKWVAVGDSLAHDIAGAKNLDLPAILIAGGIHEKQLFNGAGQIDLPAAQQLFTDSGISPDYILPKLFWD